MLLTNIVLLGFIEKPYLSQLEDLVLLRDLHRFKSLQKMGDWG